MTKQILQGEKYLQLIIISLCICIVGTTCNFKVMEENEGKMPVKNFYTENKDYITFYDDNEVNHPYLSDRIHMFRSIWSIGDIFMVIGIISMLTNFGLYRILVHKRRKKK